MEDKWISVENKPLVISIKNGWECTDEGMKTFLAAVPYEDSRYPEKQFWWIRQCIIEEDIGLCIVGDDENTPAGWEIESITHYMIIEPPKQ